MNRALKRRLGGLLLVVAASLASAYGARGFAGRVELRIPAPAFRAKGDTSAPIEIVEYSDFQCPACRAAETPLKEALGLYGDKVRLVFRDDPLTRIHPWAFEAAVAAECAGRMGTFWPYHDMLYDKQGEWVSSKDPKALFRSYAQKLGLRPKAFDACLSSPDAASSVRSDMQQARNRWISGTPTFFINGRRFVGGNQFASLGIHWIDQILKKRISP